MTSPKIQDWAYIDVNDYENADANIKAVVDGKYENVIIINFVPTLFAAPLTGRDDLLYSRAILNRALIDFMEHGDSIVRLSFFNCTFTHITLFMVANLIMSAKNLKQLTIDNCEFIMDYFYKVCLYVFGL